MHVPIFRESGSLGESYFWKTFPRNPGKGCFCIKTNREIFKVGDTLISDKFLEMGAGVSGDGERA